MTPMNAPEQVNEAFHGAYGTARRQTEREPPILVVLAEELVLVTEGDQTNVVCSPPAFHLVKAVAHAPLAVFILLSQTSERPALTSRLGKVRAMLGHTRNAIAESALDEEAQSDLRAIVDTTTRRLDEFDTSAEALGEFARAMGPHLDRATAHAVRVQLKALHDCTNDLLAPLPMARVAELEVVVVGAHQARERSLGMQYYAARLGDAGAGRLTYAENVSTVDAALTLVGTRRFDRRLARAFFGDARRLERDVLGDAVLHMLAEMTPQPLGDTTPLALKP